MTVASSEIKRRQLAHSIKPAITEKKGVGEKAQNERQTVEGGKDQDVDGWEGLMFEVWNKEAHR